MLLCPVALLYDRAYDSVFVGRANAVPPGKNAHANKT